MVVKEVMMVEISFVCTILFFALGKVSVLGGMGWVIPLTDC